MPLPICALPGRPHHQADINVIVLIGLDPRAGAHVVLAHHRPGLHRGVDFIAGAIKKAGVDEHHAIGCSANAGGEIHRCAALFVHDAHFHGVARQAQHILDARKNFIRERNLIRPVHFGFDDINGTRTRIADRTSAAQIVHGDENADRGVHQAFGNFGASAIERRIRIHVVADIADQHQAAAMQGKRAASGRIINAIRAQAALDQSIALGEARRQRAVHQAKPIAIDEDLVLRVHCRNRIFHVDDGGDGRLDDQIGDARSVRFTDGMIAINHDLKVHAIVDEQHRFGLARSREARKLRWRLEARASWSISVTISAPLNAIASCVRMRANRKRRCQIQHCTAPWR